MPGAAPNLPAPSLPHRPLGGVRENAEGAPGRLFLAQGHRPGGEEDGRLVLRLGNSKLWRMGGGGLCDGGCPETYGLHGAEGRRQPPSSSAGDVRWDACPLPEGHRDLNPRSLKLEVLIVARRIRSLLFLNPLLRAACCGISELSGGRPAAVPVPLPGAGRSGAPPRCRWVGAAGGTLQLFPSTDSSLSSVLPVASDKDHTLGSNLEAGFSLPSFPHPAPPSLPRSPHKNPTQLKTWCARVRRRSK